MTQRQGIEALAAGEVPVFESLVRMTARTASAAGKILEVLALSDGDGSDIRAISRGGVRAHRLPSPCW